MKLLIVLVLVVCAAVALGEEPAQNQCDQLCSLDVNEIDISKFMTGTVDEKKEIASLFDKTFHESGIIRLVNVNLTGELIETVEEFFALDQETKLQYFINGSFYITPGYKPSGSESVGSKKGKSSAIDSAEVFFTFFKSGSQEVNLSAEQLPELFRHVIPEYILQARQIIFQVHRIADMALDLEENTFDQNYTNDQAMFQLRLTKYFPTDNEQSLALGEHRDYLGFTLLHNDDVPGLEVNVNGRWFRVEAKPDTLLMVGGEFIQRWTNNYWISALHRVAAVTQFRHSALFFSGPDLGSTIQTLPCKKCMQKESNYTPVTGQEQLKQKSTVVM